MSEEDKSNINESGKEKKKQKSVHDLKKRFYDRWFKKKKNDDKEEDEEKDNDNVKPIYD